jgi:hypothetical protein
MFLLLIVLSRSLQAQSNAVDGEFWPLPEYRVFGERASPSDADAAILHSYTKE